MKRKALTGLAALTLFDVVAAHAQPAIPNWTGFYLGANAGGEWGRVSGFYPVVGFPNPSFGPTPNFPSPQSNPFLLNPMSGVIGSQLGYNFQITPRWLVGLEGDFEWGRGSDTAYTVLIDPVAGPSGFSQFSATIDWSASLRGRVGYTEGLWLFYATGGVSFLREQLSVSESGNSSYMIGSDHFSTFASGAGSEGKTFVGWVVGAGIENKLSEKLTIRVQYLFADYGHVDFNTAISGVSTATGGTTCSCITYFAASGIASGSLTTQTATIGLNFRVP